MPEAEDILRQILAALKGAATAPGAPPAGTSTYQNPYGFNPLSNQNLAPIFQQNETTQMMGALLPMVINAIDPKLGSRLSQISNLSPALAGAAQLRQDQQSEFTRVGDAARIKMLTRGMEAFGVDPGVADFVSEAMPVLQLFAPGLANAVARFDVGGTGFGFDAAMNSVLRTQSMASSTVSARQAGLFAQEFIDTYQRKGKGRLEGIDVLDHERTKGLTISEMASLQAGLQARGIVGDAFAGTNSVEALSRHMTDIERLGPAGRARTIDELREAVGSERFDALRSAQRKSNIAESSRVRDGMAEAIQRTGSLFTEMQGNSEALLGEIEKLTGTMDKLTPEKVGEALNRFTKLVERSGLSATELSRAIDTWSARTGNNDRALGGEIIARAAKAQRTSIRAGSSVEDSERVATMATEVLTDEMNRQYGMTFAHLLNDQGRRMVNDAAKVLSDPNSTPEQRAEAQAVMAIDGRYIEKMVNPEDVNSVASLVRKAKSEGMTAKQLAAYSKEAAKSMGYEGREDEYAKVRVEAIKAALVGNIGNLTEAERAGVMSQLADEKIGVSDADREKINMTDLLAGAAAFEGAGSDEARQTMAIEALLAAQAKAGVSKEGLNKLRTAVMSGRLQTGAIDTIVDRAGLNLDSAQISAALFMGSGAEVPGDVSGKEGSREYSANTISAASIELLEQEGDIGVGDMVKAVAKASGILGKEVQLTPEQVTAFANSRLMTDMKAAIDEKDPVKSKAMLDSVIGNAAEVFGKSADETRQLLGGGDTEGIKRAIADYEKRAKEGEKKETAKETPAPEQPASGSGPQSGSGGTVVNTGNNTTITLLVKTEEELRRLIRVDVAPGDMNKTQADAAKPKPPQGRSR